MFDLRSSLNSEHSSGRRQCQPCAANRRHCASRSPELSRTPMHLPYFTALVLPA